MIPVDGRGIFPEGCLSWHLCRLEAWPVVIRQLKDTKEIILAGMTAINYAAPAVSRSFSSNLAQFMSRALSSFP